MEGLNLPGKIRKIVDSFITGLKNIYPDQLISVVLYGSAASGEYASKYSNVNLVILLKDASIPSIRKAAPLINKNRFAVINPLFFTEGHIKNSTDVFPIEFLDMKENYVVLYGRDVLKDIQIDVKNLRFQCEQELKSKILGIKKLYVRTRNKFILKNILFKSITSSLHIMRNVIRLKGRTPSYKKEDVLNELSRELAVDVSCLRKILDARNKNIRLSRKEIDELFTCLVEALENISDKVDRL